MLVTGQSPSINSRSNNSSINTPTPPSPPPTSTLHTKSDFLAFQFLQQRFDGASVNSV